MAKKIERNLHTGCENKIEDLCEENHKLRTCMNKAIGVLPQFPYSAIEILCTVDSIPKVKK